MARPTKATPETVAEICKLVEIGVPLKFAAGAQGIGESTLHSWMSQDGEVSRALTRAKCKGAVTLHGRALAGGKGSREALHLLERLRQYRDEYGLKQIVEHSGPDGGPIESVNLTEMTDEQIEQLRAERGRS